MKNRWIALYVENQVGVLAKVSGLFSGKSYNLQSLTVGTTEDETVSRMTICVTSDDITFEQIKKQLNRMVEVIKVIDLTDVPIHMKEILFAKVLGINAAEKLEVFQIAQVFHVPVEYLVESETQQRELAQQVRLVCDSMDQERTARRRAKWRQDSQAALAVAAGYLIIYLLGRLIWCSQQGSNLLGWLALNRPQGEHSYLYGWLLSSRLFWVAMATAVRAALLGRRWLAYTTGAVFLAGLLLGIALGPYPPGAPYGHGDYGWAIWGGIFLASVLLGILAEKQLAKKKSI